MKPSVLIIGGGPAGLTAALRLSASGLRITVLDRLDRLGGGASGTPQAFFGWQTATLALLKTLGTSHLVGSSDRLAVEFCSAQGHRAPLRRPRLPGALHTIFALALFRGLPAKDRLQLLNHIERTWEGDPPLPEDLDFRTADAWLKGWGQSKEARSQVWSPLCRFLLGDDLTVVSAKPLVSLLRLGFLSSRQSSRLAIPARTIDTLLVQPAVSALGQAGASIRLASPMASLQLNASGITGIRLQGGDTLRADWYVLAVPHRILRSFLPDRLLTHYAYFEQLTKLTDSPAVTASLRLDRKLPAPCLVLLAGRSFHWIVGRNSSTVTKAESVVSLVATGIREPLEWEDRHLVERALADLGAALPTMRDAKLRDYQVLRDPYAILSARPGSTSCRPLPQSPIPNLVLAGAWTDTALPAMLESAIVSGANCADTILAKGIPHPASQPTSPKRRGESPRQST